MNRKNYIKTGVFFIIFFILFYFGQKIVTAPEHRNYQWVRGFYAEEENSLDAVYLGSSNCYSFWNPLVAWEEYGIAVWPYSTNSQPFIAAEYLMKEVRKTQPDTVFVVNINSIAGEKLTFKVLHYLLDYMPFSMNKLALTDYLCDVCDFSLSERREYYIPMIRYHSRWSELEERDFSYYLNGYKGAADYNDYLDFHKDISADYLLPQDCTDLPQPEKDPVVYRALDSLLDYCTQEDVKVVFVAVPRAEKSAEDLLRIKELSDTIAGRGFDMLFLTDKTEEIGLDLTKDYYNETHTNIHGSIKFTHYISEYLVEKFGFEDKRGQAEYASWDAGFEKYMDDVLAYCVPAHELDSTARDYTLPVPQNFAAEAEGGSISLSWDKTEGAEGYAIYRRDGKDKPLELLAHTETASFTDTTAVTGRDITYGYTVAAFRTENGTKIYGDCFLPVYNLLA